AMIHIPGTKTEDSDAWLPLAPVALETLRALKKQSDPNCPWVFPGRSPRTKGKKVYSRRRLFELIQKKTGIHLRPKDLRDYFATEVASKVNDPTVIMKLLRHTNLKTTTGYLRTVEDRMRAAVGNMGQRETKPKHTLSSDHNEGVNSVQVLGASTGGGLGAEKLPKNDQNELRAKLAQLTKLLIANGFFNDTENGEKKVRVASSNRAKIKSLLTVPVEPYLDGLLAFLTS